MTTSYELSLKLKELGVPQEGGEYYFNIAFKMLHHKSEMVGVTDYSNLCRALTLGELVRELGVNWSITPYVSKEGVTMYIALIHSKDRLFDVVNKKPMLEGKASTPEEAAGELLAELNQKEG